MKRQFEERSEQAPAGIKVDGGHGLPPVPSLHVGGIGDFAAGVRHYQRTFEVEEKHERLASGDGVKFNIEAVPAPEELHLKKPTISREAFLAHLKSEAHGSEPQQDARLEAVARCPDNLVYAGSQGFFAACLSAFAQHLPLAISPDHIWALISFAFAQHVDKNAEELRANFVKHEGKKRLEVRADHMVMSGGGDPDSGTSPEVWEQTIFSSFSEQIREHIGDKVHGAIASDFSTTTATSRAVHEISLMSAMKHYFSYRMKTCCGIPNITMLGLEEDWVALRTRAEDLGELMTPSFAKTWMPLLLPVLDEFVASYKGQVNHSFWQSMVKLRYRGGSGARSVVSGWLQILFPYLKGGRLNESLHPWQEMYFQGPDPKNIPPIVSSAPVDWDYYGTIHDLHFNAGFMGCKQDPSDGTLTPVLGWYVTHDPPSNPKERLVVVKAEIEALLKGHKEEAKAAVLDKNQPWHRRISVLYLEQKAIHELLMKELLAEEEGNAMGRRCYRRHSDRHKEELKERAKAIEMEKIDLGPAPIFASADSMLRALANKAA